MPINFKNENKPFSLSNLTINNNNDINLDNKSKFEKLKKEATTLFQNKNFLDSNNKFEQLWKFIELNKNENFFGNQQEEEKIELLKLHLSCTLSISNWKKAIEISTLILDLNPMDTHTFLQRANAYKHLEDYDESILDLNRVLEIDPSNKKAKLDLKKIVQLNDKLNNNLKNNQFQEFVVQQPQL